MRAGEKLDAEASGKIVVRKGTSAAEATQSKRKRTYRLRTKSKSFREGQDEKLFLEPKKRKHARKIAEALKQGLTVRAKPPVQLLDEAGNAETEKLEIELRRRT